MTKPHQAPAMRYEIPCSGLSGAPCIGGPPTICGGWALASWQKDLLKTASCIELLVWAQPLLLASLNDALNLIGIRIIEVGDQWSVSEGNALIRFSDNVVRPTSLPPPLSNCALVSGHEAMHTWPLPTGTGKSVHGEVLEKRMVHCWAHLLAASTYSTCSDTFVMHGQAISNLSCDSMMVLGRCRDVRLYLQAWAWTWTSLHGRGNVCMASQQAEAWQASLAPFHVHCIQLVPRLCLHAQVAGVKQKLFIINTLRSWPRLLLVCQLQF